MALDKASQFYIAAAHKSSGKTLLSLGLSAAMTARGHAVQTFKKGPDYIDPIWLSTASGRSCYNLDFHTMSRQQIQSLYQTHSHNAEITLIEGNKGLFDGMDVAGSDSNAALARLIDIPIVLVIDCQGMTRGIAPLLHGYLTFEHDLKFSGVVLNRVGGSRHEQKLRSAIEQYTPLPVFGAIHNNPALRITERHLGLQPANEDARAELKVDQIAEYIADVIDIDLLLQSTRSESLSATKHNTASDHAMSSSVRIGVAKDQAFGFYYPDDFEKLQTAGAELVFFDTINDKNLPRVDGLFIGGGFPEVMMAELEENQTLRHQIRDFVERGGPVYCECGGLMYLGRSISWENKNATTVGALPFDTRIEKKTIGRGYVSLKQTGRSSWGDIYPSGETIPAHEFHYSKIENLQSGLDYAYEVVRGHGIDGQRDGLIYKNVLACYSHLRGVEPNLWPQRFIEFVRKCTK